MTEERAERLKILISAYACEPNRGSEPGVGWNWSVEAARDHEVWVLTWTKFRQPIEDYQRENPNPNLHFVYYELPRWAQRLALSERMHYVLWQFFVLPMARRLHRRERFDVIHHLTFNTVEVPGLLWTLKAPFIWGPVGGGQIPAAALKSYFRAIWLAEIPRALRKRFLRFNPMVRLAADRAACILVTNQDTMRLLQPLARAPLVEEAELAVTPPEPYEPRVAGAKNAVMTIVWAGRFIARKGPLLALDVAAELQRRGVAFRLLMAGDGPWEELVAQEIQQMQLSQEVQQVGLLSHQEMTQFYGGGDVFLFSSLQDTGGTVLLEAMASGLPVVSLDQHGAATLLTDETAIKVPVRDKAQVIRDMAFALEKLAKEPEHRLALGRAARERVASQFSWQSKRQLLVRLYAQAAGRKPVNEAVPETTARELVGSTAGIAGWAGETSPPSPLSSSRLAATGEGEHAFRPRVEL